MKWPNFKIAFVINYVYFIPLSIFILKALEILFQIFGIDIVSSESSFLPNFLVSISVLYGVLLPLILIRVWQQFDDIDRQFDREADAVKSLYEDIFLLRGTGGKIGKDIAILLRDYVLHVIKNHPREFKESEEARITGDQILEQIRYRFRDLFHPNVMKTRASEFLILEIFQRFNNLVDIRGDRISSASQRLFASVRIVALIASILFVVPFYFVGFSISSPLMDNILTAGVTLLVIFIYLIIEDFDEPFMGAWKISDESWQRLLEEIDSNERKLELETLSEQSSRKPGVSTS